MIKKAINITLLAAGILTSHILYTYDLPFLNNESPETENIKNQFTEKQFTENHISISENQISENDFFKNYVTEFFIIESVEKGIVKGSLVNGSGEGIYFNLNKEYKELEKHETLFNLNENDIISISWHKENYHNENWNDIYKVVFIKNEKEKNSKQDKK